jgi:hypothetical protein
VDVFTLGRWVLDSFMDACSSMDGTGPEDICAEPPAG